MPKKNDYGVSPEDFVRAWAESQNVQEVADKTGMPIDIVYARSSSYRKQGVLLKKLGRRKMKKRLDVEALNRLIADTESGQGDSAKTPPPTKKRPR